MTGTQLRDIAAAWAENGWAVFPCRANKSPGTPNGFKDASRDPLQDFPRPWSMIGGVPGSAGLVVVDVDVQGGASLTDLPAEWLETRRHKTRSGGWHLIFRARPGADYGNGPRADLGPGIDIRHDRGYIILPPSPGYSLDHDVEPLDAPAELEISAAGATATAAPAPSTAPPIPRGQQDHELRAVANHAYQLGLDEMAVRDVVRHTIETRCTDQDPRNPYTERDIERLARPVPDTLTAAINRGELDDTEAAPEYLKRERRKFRDLTGLERKIAEPYGGNLNMPRGTIGVLTGQQGTGKGLLEVAEIAAITQAGHGAVIVSDEDSIEHTILPRLEAAGADLSKVYMPDSLRLPHDVADVVDFAHAHDVRLVVVDPWTNHMGDINVDKPAEVRAALMALKHAAELAQFAALLTAHPNKNSMNPDPLERVAHASALTQVARSAFWIVRDPRPEHDDALAMFKRSSIRLVAQVKANLTAFAHTMEYRIDTVALTEPDQVVPVLRRNEHDVELDWLAIHQAQQQQVRGSGRGAKAPVQSATWERMHAYLKANGPTKRRALLTALGIDPHDDAACKAVTRAVDWARGEGLLDPADGHGTYQLSKCPSVQVSTD
jgi:hypothetical protein